MKYRSLCVLLSMLVVASVAFAGTFTEDFTTTTFKDAANTTADWNTTAGQLKLFPFAPSLVGGLSMSGIEGSFAVDGHYAFIADGAGGLRVVDISNPASPTLVAGYPTPYAMDVAVDGDHAFVADETNGLMVFDITNPEIPTLLGSVATPGAAYSVAVDGNTAFVAAMVGGLQVVDITNPASPAVIGGVATPDFAYDVAVAGDHAFVADSNAGLKVIDVSNPASPAIVGSYATSGQALGVAVDGSHVFVADGSGALLVLDDTNPASPTLLGSVVTPRPAYDVAVAGNRAYVALYDNGLQIVDVTNPASPALAGGYVTPGYAYGVGVDGDLAFITSYSGGFYVIRVSQPAPPAQIYPSAPDGPTYSIAVAGDVLFEAGGSVNAYDISDPANTTHLATYLNAGIGINAQYITLAGNLAFVAGESSGAADSLDVIDVSDPANPSKVGSVYFGSGLNPYGIAVAGNYAYVCAGPLDVIDISDPANPTVIKAYSTANNASDVVVKGDDAFVADEVGGLQVIDISNPANPTTVGSYVTPGFADGVAVTGNLALVADGDSGLLVIDISNPSAPTLLGSVPTPAFAKRVAVAGDRAFVADTNSGLQVIDISDPTSPTLVGSLDTSVSNIYGTTAGNAWDVTLAGDVAYVADANNGPEAIQVFEHDSDQTRKIGQSLPVDGGTDTILGAQLTSTQTGNVSWELSADGGMTFQPFMLGGGAAQFTSSGTDLVWRSTLEWSPAVHNPTVSDVTIDWLVASAYIISASDAPNDQGGWLNLQIPRSGYDFVTEDSLPVTGYQIYRRVDAATAAMVQTRSASADLSADNATQFRSFSPSAVRRVGSRTFVIGSRVASTATASFPAGTWEAITWVAATQSDSYKVLAPTAVDSSAAGPGWSVYLVTTHTTTPSIWFVSAPDSGYSVDNIAPSVPQNVVAAYNTGSGNQLTWNANTEPDFQYYRVYRDIDPAFVPSSGNFVAGTATPAWTDPNYDGGNVYYKVTAVDHDGNESAPASPGATTPVHATPTTFALFQNVPNPFNPETTIRYDVARGGGNVMLQIYDVDGRLVKTLRDDHESAGDKTVVWNGHNNAGQPVASGDYFYRLTAPGFTATKKMVLLK